MTTTPSIAIDRDLLRTKFAIPQPRASLIQRDSLLARLDDALRAKLTLISAPAGFGKTTLTSQFLALNSQLPSAWLALDSGDNDPIRFWRYVINACRTFRADLGSDSLDALRASSQGHVRPALIAFLNELSQLDSPCVLVLDDLHAITSPVIHEALAFWLEQLPSTVRVIALTREDPPWPLARWRARGQLRELRSQDLRFTLSEAGAFASQTFAQPISSDAITQLDARLEGWPAGWRMTLTLAAHEPQGAAALLVEQLAPKHIVDFFVSDVLAAQPQDTQNFLLRTAFLNRLNGSLGDAVTGRTDSAAQLERLDRNNVFLERLSTERGETWYRYHNLFAEAMRHVARQRLGETTLREMAARASAWHQAHGNLPEAIEAALAADEFERAARLIEQFVERGVYEEVYSQRRWLERLSQAVLLAHPVLCFAYASAVLFTDDRHAPATRERIEPYLAQAERTWRAEGSAGVSGSDERLGELLAFRAVVAFWQGDFSATSALAREALTLLPDSSAQWRGVSLLQVVVEELRAGRMAELPPLAMESRALCAASGNLPAALASLTALAEIGYWHGEFRQAESYAEQILDEAASPRLQFQSDRQTALTQLSLISFERNDLKRAHDLIGQAVDLGLQADEPDGLKRAMLLQLRVQHALGETEPAHSTLRQFIAAEKSPVLIREARLLQARCALLEGDATIAQRALANLPSSEPKSHLDDESESLLRARVFLAQRKPGDALNLVREWRADARTNERIRPEIEWALVEALTHAQRDDLPRARLALADALKPAQPERITRLFIEAMAPLAALIRESLPHWRGADIEPFARELLALMGDDVTGASEQPLTEPLSIQERRVLRLLVAGMTNAEIARELTVSVNTVKTQTQSIYRKLNVGGRNEAKETARRMKLI